MSQKDHLQPNSCSNEPKESVRRSLGGNQKNGAQAKDAQFQDVSVNVTGQLRVQRAVANVVVPRVLPAEGRNGQSERGEGLNGVGSAVLSDLAEVGKIAPLIIASA